ncbi:MAG: parallel beta-helix domain-containing protein [Myxococcota bacterium]
MRRSIFTLSSVLAVLLQAPAAQTAVCPDRTPTPISAAAAASLKCQKAIAKRGAKFLKAKVKALSKCRLKRPAGACPDPGTTLKIQEAAMKAGAKIAKLCADDATQAGLASSYASLTREEVIASCMLSQQALVAELAVGNSTGISTEPFPNDPNDPNEPVKARAGCIKALSKAEEKYLLGALKIASKCLDAQMKLGTSGDLAPICIGKYAAGVFTPPTDPKTATKQSELIAKIEAKIAKKCEDAPGYIPSIFACLGAATVSDLQRCVVCDGWDRVLDALEHEYAESGIFVANDPNAPTDPNLPGELQLAVDAAAPGTKLLIESGDHPEPLVIPTDGLQLVGCGAAVDDRPRLVRPAGPGPFVNGIFAAGRNDLVFQSLELFDWDENGIFVTDANNVSFRDIVADGQLNSTYGVFPVLSDGVLIEACSVRNVSDAGLYVGQSTNITLRYNTAEFNVAGIEIENSANAVAHNNYAAHNTGGLLVFKLPGLAVQLSNDHQISHNVSELNNTPNFGGGIVGVVPDGTGMLILSNDSTTFEYNLVRLNDSLGFALVDQQVINFLTGTSIFDPLSPDQAARDNKVRNNVFTANGLNPDSTPPNATPIGGDIVFTLLDAPAGLHGNCFEQNLVDTPVLLTAPDCP